MAASRHKHLMNIFGMSCGAFGEILNATEDSITKLSGLSGSQLLFGRYVFQFAVGLIWWITLKYFYNNHELGHWYGNTPHISKIWAYGSLQFINILCFWYGIRFVPIGISYCIMATGDALTFYIAYIYFKEALFKTFPISVSLRILSLLLLIQKPSVLFRYFMDTNTNIAPSELHLGGLILVSISAVAWSLSNVTLKATAETNDPNHNNPQNEREPQGAHFLQLEITHALQTLVFWIPFMMIVNSWTIRDKFIGTLSNDSDWNYSLHSFGVLCVIGVVGFGADVLTIMAYQFGDVSKVIWAQRMDVVAAYVYQIWLFKEPPNGFEICGAILMMVAAFLPLFEELSDYCKKGHESHDSSPSLQVADEHEALQVHSNSVHINHQNSSSDESIVSHYSLDTESSGWQYIYKDAIDIGRNLRYDSVFMALVVGVLMMGLYAMLCFVVIIFSIAWCALQWQYWL